MRPAVREHGRAFLFWTWLFLLAALRAARTFGLVLANDLVGLSDWAGAEAEIQEAIAIRENLPSSTFRLGWLRLRAYRYEEAMPLFRAGMELAAKQGISLDDGDMRECERMIGVRKVLDGIDAGGEEPAGASELADLGKVCYGLHRYARAAEFAAKALHGSLAPRQARAPFRGTPGQNLGRLLRFLLDISYFERQTSARGGRRRLPDALEADLWAG